LPDLAIVRACVSICAKRSLMTLLMLRPPLNEFWLVLSSNINADTDRIKMISHRCTDGASSAAGWNRGNHDPSCRSTLLESSKKFARGSAHTHAEAATMPHQSKHQQSCVNCVASALIRGRLYRAVRTLAITSAGTPGRDSSVLQLAIHAQVCSMSNMPNTIAIQIA
jgi:hypothetical protein